MFRTIQDFLDQYRTEREGTLKILSAISDSSLDQEVASNHRNIGRMAWHITTTYPEMMKLADLDLNSLDENAPLPTDAVTILNSYRDVTAQMTDQIQSKWTDETLLEMRNCYGADWKIGFLLETLIRHEIHHRGQMTVLMRQAGLPVPGVYGPSYEEWTNYGAKPPKV